MLFEFFYICLFIFEVVNRFYKHFNSNLLLSGCLSLNIYNSKKLKKKINLGFFEVFSPSFQENNLLFNAFALKSIVKNNIDSSFNFKKKDFVKDHKIYKFNHKIYKFNSVLLSLHKIGNTFLSGLMIKKLSFKANSFSKIKKFSFLMDDCLRNTEVSIPAFKFKYSSYYDIGISVNSDIHFFFECLLRNFQIPVNLQENRHMSNSVIKKNNFIYSL